MICSSVSPNCLQFNKVGTETLPVCAAIFFIIFNKTCWQPMCCIRGAPQQCHQQLHVSPLVANISIMFALPCGRRVSHVAPSWEGNDCSVGAHMLMLRSLSLPLQVHMPFMRYISVGCVVGIIAGFCIGPGKLCLCFLCCTKEQSCSHMDTTRQRLHHWGNRDASVPACYD